MVKKLFTQIRNEWRGNLWLALELLVVSVVLWYVTDFLYTNIATMLEPRGFDTEHCYKVDLGELTPKSPDYRAYENAEQRIADIRELAERLRRRPEVEVVSLSQNSHPYNGNNSGIFVELAGDTLRSQGYVVRRTVTPDFVRVFRYRGTRGETPEQLAAMLERGEILVSDNLFEVQYGKRMTDLTGRAFHLEGDTTRSYRLGAALQNVRYSDYVQARGGYTLLNNLDIFHPDWINKGIELCLRVRSDMDHDFIARLKEDSEKQLRVGNIFVSEVRDFRDIRKNFQRLWSNQMRNYYTGMGFLLLNIFLGLLGTFWFRTQQRRGEIALHKVSGATDGMVFRRLMGEGVFLLLLVTPVAVFVNFHLAYSELNSWRNGTTLEWNRLLSCAFFSFVLIALMIFIGIVVPARKAMKISPTEALHDE